MDPTRGFPGAFVVYQRGYDGHAGAGLNAATSTAYTAEVWEPLFNNQVILCYRNEYQNDGLGTSTHFNYVNAAWFVTHHVTDRDANGLIFNVEDSIKGQPRRGRASSGTPRRSVRCTRGSKPVLDHE